MISNVSPKNRGIESVVKSFLDTKTHNAMINLIHKAIENNMNNFAVLLCEYELKRHPTSVKVFEILTYISYNAGKFGKEGLILIKKLFQKHDNVIMVGGSGMYAKALMDGLDKFPKVKLKAIKKVEEVYKKAGLKGLQLELAKNDPDYYKTVDIKNPRRIIRALEVYETAQKPYSYFLNQTRSVRPFQGKTLYLQMPREKLYERINQRVDEMVSIGLKEEARELLPYKSLDALQTVGYKELFEYFEGKTNFQEATEEIKKNTRRYAKRQLTWFNKINSILIKINKVNQTFDQIIKKLE